MTPTFFFFFESPHFEIAQIQHAFPGSAWSKNKTKIEPIETITKERDVIEASAEIEEAGGSIERSGSGNAREEEEGNQKKKAAGESTKE